VVGTGRGCRAAHAFGAGDDSSERGPKLSVAFRSEARQSFNREGGHESSAKTDGGAGMRTDTKVQRLLSVEEVAEVLGVPVRTLYQWRHKGVGPLGLRVGRHLRYRAADVSAWIDGRAAEEARSPG
jgi:excisionase family DNA binding protein